MIPQLFNQLVRATKRRHLIYRAKKDGATRHWILDKKVGDTENGNIQLMVFDVDPETNRPTKESSKIREVIPERIEQNFVRW